MAFKTAVDPPKAWGEAVTFKYFLIKVERAVAVKYAPPEAVGVPTETASGHFSPGAGPTAIVVETVGLAVGTAVAGALEVAAALEVTGPAVVVAGGGVLVVEDDGAVPAQPLNIRAMIMIIDATVIIGMGNFGVLFISLLLLFFSR